MHRLNRNLQHARALLAKGTLLLLVPAASLLARPAWAAAGGAGAGDQAQAAGISGVVRDANGAVQMGALVQVLGQGSRTIATAFTDMHGRYMVANLAAGRYVVRASAALFVPATRTNLELRRGTSAVVDLTLAALFDPASWLPAERRRTDEAADDWKWTLRSSASRPILRAVDDEDAAEAGAGAESGGAARGQVHGKALMAAGNGGFGDTGVQTAVQLRREDAAGAATAEARVSPQGAGSARLAAGFERHDRVGGSARTVVSYESHPQLAAYSAQGASAAAGIQVYAITSAERLAIGDRIEVEAGGRAEAVRTTVFALSTHPFLHVTAHATGTWRLEYRLATDRDVQEYADVKGTGETLEPSVPTAIVRDGKLALERGRHQQFSATHKTSRASLAVAVYHDAMMNTSVSGGERLPLPADLAAPVAGAGTQQMVVDPTTGQFRTLASGGYSTTGARVTFSAPVKHAVWIAAEYSTGAAIGSDTAANATAAQACSGLSARNSQAAALAVEGRVIGSGTRVRASYRWQPSHTVTAVDPFSDFASQAYLGLLIEEPIRVGTLLPKGLNATIDITNLLAQGYRPFLSADGQTLYFAQTPRVVQAGLSFTF